MPKATYKKRKDGRYRVRYKGKDFYGATQAIANAKRDVYRRELESGLREQALGVTFGAYAIQWIETYKDGCSDRTYNAYVSIVNRAIDVIGTRRMRDITTTDIQQLFNSMRGKSSSSVKKFKMTIDSIFTAAVHDRVILTNPCYGSRPPEAVSGTHRAITDDERQLIHRSVGHHDMALAVMIMLYAGLRRGEVLALTASDIDLQKNCINVTKGVIYNGNRPVLSLPKTKAGIRSVPIIEPLKTALQGVSGGVLQDENGGIMSETAFRRKWESYIVYLETLINGCHRRWYGRTKAHKAILASGGTLPPWRECTIRPHDLRHSYVTMLYDAGVDIKTAMKWVGHADQQMIMRIYAHLTEQRERQSHTQLAKHVENWLKGSKLGSIDGETNETFDL